MVKSRKARSWAAGLLMVLFVAYYASVSLSIHSHIINGTTIVHSHLHRENHHDTNSGHHTASQLELIAILDVINCMDAVGCTFDFSPAVLPLPHHEFFFCQPTCRATLTNPSLRAPPAV